MNDLHSSNWAGSFLSRRISLLPQPTIDLLRVGAILGKEFDLTFTAKLVGQTPAQAIAALDKARDRHFVWVRPDGMHCTFVHDKIRSALLKSLSEQDRKDLHHRVALLLQKGLSRPNFRFGISLRCRRPKRASLAVGSDRGETSADLSIHWKSPNNNIVSPSGERTRADKSTQIFD